MREIKKTDDFSKNIKKLSKNDPELEYRIDKVLQDLAANGSSTTSMQIKGLMGRPVFKERVSLPGVGKRGGARLIYFLNSELVVAMFLYRKNKQENMPPKEILNAMESTDLIKPTSS